MSKPKQMTPSPELLEFHAAADQYLNHLDSMLQFETKLTLLIRAPGQPGLDLMISSETDFKDLFEFLRRAEVRGLNFKNDSH